MQEAVPVGEGSMIAILGSNIDEIKNLISKLKINGVCEIANDNAEGQIIISGDVKSINTFQKVLKNNKKKFVSLNVSAPFHCSLMKPAAEKMNSKINEINFKNSKVEIITNVKAEPEIDSNKIKDLLIQQRYSKVRWRESILYMKSKNINEFIEIGPGKVLSGLVKRINSKFITSSINSVEDIKNTNI